jgi:hypothetical protein
LYDDDIRRFASDDEFALHMSRVTAKYDERLKWDSAIDKDTLEFLQKEAKKCPGCHVLLLRSEGCNSMMCTCGKSFCYGCARDPCICCGSCGEFGHHQSRCPNRRCTVCRETGHNRFYCPTLPLCSTCNTRGHEAADCTTVCTTCHEPGHSAFRCPQMVCTTCERTGHLARSCRTSCSLCLERGHGAERCSKAVCRNCRQLGHMQSACTEPVRRHQGGRRGDSRQATSAKSDRAIPRVRETPRTPSAMESYTEPAVHTRPPRSRVPRREPHQPYAAVAAAVTPNQPQTTSSPGTTTTQEPAVEASRALVAESEKSLAATTTPSTTMAANSDDEWMIPSAHQLARGSRKEAESTEIEESADIRPSSGARARRAETTDDARQMGRKQHPRGRGQQLGNPPRRWQRRANDEVSA